MWFVVGVYRYDICEPQPKMFHWERHLNVALNIQTILTLLRDDEYSQIKHR